MTISDQIRTALVGALNTPPTRVPALWSVPPVLYPIRQFRIEYLDSGIFAVRYFHRYKAHSPAKDINVEDVRLALNALIPNGLYLYAAEVHRDFLLFFIRRYSF